MRKPSRFFLGISIGCLIVATALPARLLAQQLYGSIVGTVSDASGAIVPGATVRITETGTGQVRQDITNRSGAYSFPTMPQGRYDVTISKDGFETYIKEGVGVSADAVARVDVTISVGTASQKVQVSADAVMLQTDKAEVRTDIRSEELQEVPIPVNRNYQNLLQMVPGISPPGNSSSPAANPARGEVFSVNGATQEAANTRIEGATAINSWMTHETGYVPGLEAIESVTVTTNSLDADQGLAGSASINVQMKSGTNQLHGSGFEYNQDTEFEADPFFKPANYGKPKYIDNQAGGTIGGPIKKNKLFYFISYDGQFIRQNAAQTVTVPTASIRAGIMTGSSNSIYDPASGATDGTGRTPFPGNTIPTNRLDPIALKIQNLYPLPNEAGSTSNYYATGDYSMNRHKIDSKVNFNATRKLTLTARLGAEYYFGFNPDIFGDNGAGVNSSATRDGNMSGTVFNGTISGTYLVTPRLIVDSYFGYTRLDTSQTPPSVSKGNLGETLFNLPGTNGAGYTNDPGYAGYPTFEISSYTNFGKYPDAPVYYFDPAYDYVANGSWVKGTHNIKFGFNTERIDNNNWEMSTNGGVFNFGTGPTQLNGGSSGNQYNSYATFLLGYTTGATNNFLQGGGRNTSRMSLYSFYVRDQWQASRNLTVSLGVRWDYAPFGRGANRGFETYNFQTNTMYLCGLGTTPTDCGVSVPKTDFSPRLGVAWRATPSFVVRAGFGINYDPNPLAWVRDFVGEAEISYSPTWPTPASSYTPSSMLTQGIPLPVFPTITNGVIPNFPATQGFVVPPSKYHMPYIESWNFTIQKQLPHGFFAQSGYVGNRQIKELEKMNVNYSQPGGGTASEALYQLFGRTGASNLIENYGRNSYDGLQTRLSRNFSSGLMVNAIYSFSKALAPCCNSLEDTGPSIVTPQYLNLNKAFWTSQRTNSFAMNGVYILPFGPGKHFLAHGAAGAVLGGWEMTGIWSMYSGLPFSVSASGTSLNSPGNSQRANQVLPNVQIYGKIGSTASWFNPLAFAPVTTPTFGTAGFNDLFGPGAVNLDFALVREFLYRERIHLQFRADAFNAANTPHFSNPNGNVSNLVLGANGTITSLGGYTAITSTNGGIGREGIDQRILQLGVRVRF